MLALIVCVAALNILIALTMMVMEKTRDIAVMMSFGVRVDQVRKIFLLQGGVDFGDWDGAGVDRRLWGELGGAGITGSFIWMRRFIRWTTCRSRRSCWML